MDQIKAVVSEEHTEIMEEIYDIYLLPPGEDPESCQSYLRMRNKDGKYSLMFEVSSLPFDSLGSELQRFCDVYVLLLLLLDDSVCWYA